MNRYVSTFTTGFGSVVKKLLMRDLAGVKIIKIQDGFIQYSFNGNYQQIKKLIYLNNTFSVLTEFKGNNLSFGAMVKQTARTKHRLRIQKGTCRVRFSRENQFQKVPDTVRQLAEKQIKEYPGMQIDRIHPDTEIWYIIRSEGIGFCGQLLTRRAATEKNLHKGELRPEFAYLMCSGITIRKGSTVCDPFCGYGAIPRQLLHFPAKKIIASDIDEEKIRLLRKTAWAGQKRISLRTADAASLRYLADHSVDTVITDPPWGCYDNISDIREFYGIMLKEILRIIKKDGAIVVLSARKEEFTDACGAYPVKIINQIHTLVNGKKAALYILRPL